MNLVSLFRLKGYGGQAGFSNKIMFLQITCGTQHKTVPACGGFKTICIYRRVVPASINTFFEGQKKRQDIFTKEVTEDPVSLFVEYEI